MEASSTMSHEGNKAITCKEEEEEEATSITEEEQQQKMEENLHGKPYDMDSDPIFKTIIRNREGDEDDELIEYVYNNEDNQLEELDMNTQTNTSKYKYAVIMFYIAHGLSSWSDRMWYFAMPLVFSSMYPNTLLPVALFQLIILCTCVLLGPHIGYLVDKRPRYVVMISSILTQNLAVCICSLLLVFLLYITGERQRDPNVQQALFVWPFKTTLSVVIYLLSILLGAISELASMASSVSFQKDWAIVISKLYNVTLNDMNAMLRRIDLFCNILSPIVFSFILTYTNTLSAIIFVCAWNFISMFPELICMVIVYQKTPDLHLPKQDVSDERPANAIRILINGWRTYAHQGVFLCSIAFIFLFITVLHSGPLMLSFLASLGLNRTIIAVFYASCAIGGIIATFATPYVISKLKVVKGGLYCVWFQLTSLIVGTTMLAIYYFMGDPLQPKCNAFCLMCAIPFLVAIIVSRFGLYGFDLAEIQIMQLYVAEKDRGTVNATEKSLTKVAELVIYLFAVLLSKPSQFFFLATISTAFIGMAAITYTIWCRTKHAQEVQQLEENPDQNQLDEEELVE